MRFAGNEHVLDVATGTGSVALACAQRLGAGHVTAIDLSDGMLAKAKVKAQAQQLSNLEFHCRDMEDSTFTVDSFDAACCGFGIFFLPDMEAGLKSIAKHVKPGGAIGISSFTGAVMEPLSQKFIERILTYGVAIPSLSWKRLDSAEKIRTLYQSAGLEQLYIHTHHVGYHLARFEEWWDILWYSGFRGLLNQLSSSDLARFRPAHQEEIELLADEQGIWLNVEILISVGYKPV
ncbi:Ubiquinone/menaquinone biosynthesis C-methylase UbiE [Candidatus Nitrotoga sp. BS]|uniref:class I SAM-dependent methyltransferase n=1 Tax=Candidatus Nitrotoga sp. BS TaxID=2890408 RepID=UPI001EF19849|nr:class I SAM-dependent methyltransferase [Candidatus Nitrotoga sp. BS]CAH1205226.1 Ubiquinone/menaquinone biosynthesis C-methylase UbiE [Candidatus Nitrotoga sp. BS]